MAYEEQALSSDSALRAEVLHRLAEDEYLAPLGLRVGVLNAIIHLCGSVPTLDLWRRAERIAGESLPGVRGVVNRIQAPGAPNPSRTIHLNLP